MNQPHGKWQWMGTPDGQFLQDSSSMAIYKKSAGTSSVYLKQIQGVCEDPTLVFSVKIDVWTMDEANKVRTKRIPRYNIQIDTHQASINKAKDATTLPECDDLQNLGAPTMASSIYKTLWGKPVLAPNITMTVIKSLMRDGMVVAATDGSNKFAKGAHAWCLAWKENGDILVQGRGPMHNAKIDANSMRPEMGAILAAISFASHVCDQECDRNETREEFPILNLYTDSLLSILSSKDFFTLQQRMS